ncbi:phage integrase Arm DNA-binding domain-containing protein [Candidatus Williamhamiltonella defendens]|uniref:phage integrase Arm DNA-binding domain-containing protein n=1 Tax=Candidatus Williamhamiltonella defendens TaxID=138072 RepID=UPI001F17474B|nr:phage integrase Arm DNA-binding domain-containing protein [Candidatus Hamiltonella defensa]
MTTHDVTPFSLLCNEHFIKSGGTSTQQYLSIDLIHASKTLMEKIQGTNKKSANRDLPPHLHVRNHGYYCYRSPQTGKEYTLGKENLMTINKAISANPQIFDAAVSLNNRIKALKAL